MNKDIVYKATISTSYVWRKNLIFDRKRQLLAKQKIGNNFGLPTQK